MNNVVRIFSATVMLKEETSVYVTNWELNPFPPGVRLCALTIRLSYQKMIFTSQTREFVGLLGIFVIGVSWFLLELDGSVTSESPYNCEGY